MAHRIGELTVDLDRGALCAPGGEPVALTTREQQLLRYLFQHPSTDLERSRIQSDVWDYHRYSSSRALDTVVKRLRSKIEPDREHPRFLLTVRGVGYRFEPGPPPVRSPIPRGGHASLDPFFGRAAEVERLEEERHRGARLVVLCGTAGVGKTRLASVLFERWSADGDRCLWVDCATARSEDELMTRVAVASGVSLVGTSTTAEGNERLGRALGHTLDWCFLDNLEQALEGAQACVRAWLEVGPLRVCGTSRSSLGIAGERLVPVGSLDAESAAALFRDRALAVGVDLGDDALVGPLVDALDRLPLALELAAGRTAVLDVGSLLQRLQANLLATLQADGAMRSLDAALGWGWELLSEWQQDALRQLAVFQGGFTLDAAEAVLVPSGEGPQSVLDILTALVRTSWLQVQRGPRLRYVRFAAVHDFILGRGMDPCARDRHAVRMAELGTEAAIGRFRRADAAGRRVVEDELLNLATAAAHPDGDLAARAAIAGGLCLASLGALSAAERAFEAVIERSGDTAPGPEASLQLHLALCRVAKLQRAPDVALLERLRTVAAGLGPRASAMAVLGELEWRARFEEDVAPERLDELADRLAHHDDPEPLAVARLVSLDRALFRAYPDIADRFERARAAATTARLPVLLASIHTVFASWLRDQGHAEQAALHFEQSAVLNRAIGGPLRDLAGFENDAYAAQARGRLGEAAQALREGVALCERLGIELGVAMLLSNVAGLEVQLGDYAAARADGERSTRILERLGHPSEQARRTWAEAVWRSGGVDEARAILGEHAEDRLAGWASADPAP